MSIAAKLASRSVLVFGMRIFGAGFIFLVQAAIARGWGAESLGDFLLVIAASNLLAVALPLGFQTVSTYFTAHYKAKNEGAHLRRFLRRAYGYLLATGLLVFFFGWPVLYLMGEAGTHLLPLWAPTALIGFATGLTFINTTTLIGLKRPIGGYLPDAVLRPILTLGSFGIVALMTQGPQVAPMLWVLAVAMLVLFGAQFWLVVRAIRDIPKNDALRSEEPRRWWRFAAPWVLITLASDYFFDFNLILLAGLLDRADLAIFGVSTRIFALASFGVVAVYALTLPDMFEADASADKAAFDRRVGEANLVATLLAAMLFVGVLVFGRFVLMLFGEDFVQGALPVSILCLALVVRAAFGPASLVLSMHDRPWASLPSVALGVVTLVSCNFALVPAHGLMGAAIAAFIAISVWSIALWLTAMSLAKVDVSIFNRFRRTAIA